MTSAPGSESATLQTVKQIAATMRVSERSIYQARELMRTGRTDLCEAVQRGELKLSEALKMAKPDKHGGPRDRLRELRSVWKLATPAERLVFLNEVNREQLGCNVAD